MRRFWLGICIALFFTGAFLFGVRGRSHRTITAKALKAAARSSPALAGFPKTGIAASPDSAAYARISQKLFQLPLAFEPNRGQTSAPARFLARGSGYIAFLTRKGTKLLVPASRVPKAPAGKPAGSKSPLPAAPMKTAELSVNFIGGNAAAALSPKDELPGKSNYLIGNNPANWHTNIPNYRKVAERGVYPGIDLVYYGTQRQLEYDFMVAAGADPHRIRLGVTGAAKLSIDAGGDLVAGLGAGNLRFHKPVAYQQAGGKRQAVAANYVLVNARTVAIGLGNYDPRRPLVIDPVLAYSTYLGGGGIDTGNAIAVAPDNTAFVTGGTLSGNFPTVNPFQAASGGGEDAFVSKLSADGSSLLYSTYLGGSDFDIGNGIALDTAGEAYVTGTTESPDLPVFPGQVPFPNCGWDGHCGATWNEKGLIVTNGFVTKLNVTGTGIIYSTYIGAYEHVTSQAIAVNNSGIAFITGQIGPALPVTTLVPPPPASCPPLFPIVNGFQTIIGGGVVGLSDACPFLGSPASTNAYVLALSATGTKILYSSYLGGSIQDVGFGIAADNSGNAYITGLTYSPDFPVAAAFDSANGGSGDAFLTKVDTNGAGPGSLLYSTFLGGGALDQGNAVAVDSAGTAYVAGLTESASINSVTPLNSYSGNGDGFIAKLNPAVTGAASLVWFRYLGGSLADSANGIAVDSAGDTYITGSTVSPDFPVCPSLTPPPGCPSTPPPQVFQPVFGGGNSDAFVTKLDPTGKTYVFSSFLGGTNSDIGNGIAIDAAGDAFVAGQTCSDDFPLAHPLQAAQGGNCDAFVSDVSTGAGLALNPGGLVFPAQSLGTSSQPQAATLINDGDAPLTVSNIAPPANANDPKEASQFSISGASASACQGGTLLAAFGQPGDSCTITAIYSPTIAGNSKASVTISASNGQQLVLGLSGTSSTLSLSASDLSFGNEQVGVASQPQNLTVTNDGTTVVTFSSITASGDYAETDDCTKVPLQPTTNCVISVTYKPATAGKSIGALVITDNAPGSPQIVLLTGTGVGFQADFTMSAQPSSLTVPAGQAAQYTLTLSSVGGFNQPVSLSCGGLPADGTCSASANPVTPGANTSVTLAVGTVARTFLPPGPSVKTGPPGTVRIVVLTWAALLMLMLILAAVLRKPRLRGAMAALALAVTVAMLSAACNGGTQSGVVPGTPAGTYQVTITGTSGASTTSNAITHSVTVGLVVR